MKINRKDPKEIAKAALLTANNGYVALTRIFVKRRSENKTIIFFGHTLNGNLRSFYNYLLNQPGYNVYFLCIDDKYLQRLNSKGEDRERLLSSFKYKDLATVAKADVFVSSHGPQVWWLLPVLTNIKFIDVWHGIPYKGFDDKDFDQLKHYDQVWVSSEDLRTIHVNKYGLREDQVKVTGYGRVDQLVDGTLNKKRLIKKYKLPKAKKYVLLAPTWQQDVKDRSILPFGVKPIKFFRELDEIAGKHDSCLIFRTHLNAGSDIKVEGLQHTSFMPYMEYENAEEFLFLSDILVTDWSSIAFDYLPLNRPTIFLDVPSPFKKGFSLGPEFRFGKVVNNFAKLKEAVDVYLKDHQLYLDEHINVIKKTKKVAYGKTLDGKSNLRYTEELDKLLNYG